MRMHRMICFSECFACFTRTPLPRSPCFVYAWRLDRAASKLISDCHMESAPRARDIGGEARAALDGEAGETKALRGMVERKRRRSLGIRTLSGTAS